MYNINSYNPAIIAERIKTECARQNIAVKTMLKELNLSHTAIYRMSADSVAPSYIAIARICDYLNISIDTLLNRPTPEPEPVDLNTAISTVAAAANLSADYVRGVLRLPPNMCSSTNNDI